MNLGRIIDSAQPVASSAQTALSMNRANLDFKTRLDLRVDNFPGTVMLLLKTTGHFSFSAGEKAGMREGKNTNI
jgi:hypothetical protein